MGKMHELLAVEGDLGGEFKKIIQETKKVFKDKPGLFQGFIKKLEMSADDGMETPDEIQAITTTVPERLEYTSKSAIKYFDALLQKESTNQIAVADLIVDGITIGKDLPATFLLGMESRLSLIRDALDNAPTLQSGVEWVEDNQKGKGIWKAKHPIRKYKTARTFKHKVLYEATTEHPAQIEKWEETENVGLFTTEGWSGMISPSQKHIYLTKIDKLIRAVKKARMRANETKVRDIKIAQEMFNYVFK